MFPYPPTSSTPPLTCSGWKHIPTYFSAAQKHPVVSAPTLSKKITCPSTHLMRILNCILFRSNELLADEVEKGPMQLPNSVEIKIDYNLAEKDGNNSTLRV